MPRALFTLTLLLILSVFLKNTGEPPPKNDLHNPPVLSASLLEGDQIVRVGLSSYKEAHFEVAEAHFELSLEKPRKFHKTEEVLVLLGNVYQELGQKEKALESYQQALTENPKYYVAWVNQGILHRQNKNLTEAEFCYKEALKIAPRDPHLITSLGALSVAKKEYEEAINLFKKSIDLDPTLNVSYGNMAFAYAEMGDASNATAYLDLAMRSGYKNTGALEQKIQKIKNVSPVIK